MHSRPLSQGEIALGHSVFGQAIDYAKVRICRHKWFLFQPRKIVMAPRGHIHFHPQSPHWHEDFSTASLSLQGLFIHEMVHVWQHQKGIFLPLKRHPFCRYHYALRPGWTLDKYGIEQQAEIVRHGFLLSKGAKILGAPGYDSYAPLLKF